MFYTQYPLFVIFYINLKIFIPIKEYYTNHYISFHLLIFSLKALNSRKNHSLSYDKLYHYIHYCGTNLSLGY